MRAIAVFSPTSGSGKSWFATALCRWLAREDWHVAPFQGQVEIDKGYTIDHNVTVSYSIAWQAWAAGIPVTAHLNPVVLKPQSSASLQYQLFIQGRGIGTVSRSDYYQNYYSIAKPLIYECLEKTKADHNFMVFDTYRYGLFNPTQTDTDANFELLKASPFEIAGVILVDCKHGGALNQLWGLWQRLSTENRQMIRGVVFNQWQDDRRLYDLESRWVQENIKRPVLGYLPPLSSHSFHPESALTFDNPSAQTVKQQLKIQILRLPNIARTDDLDALESEPSIELSYFDPASQLGYPDALIIPHTTQAIADLEFLHKYKCPQQLQNYAAAGGTILGICNGATILGKQVLPPNEVGKRNEALSGLGLMNFNGEILPNSAFLSQPCITLSREPFPNLPIQGEKVRYSKHQFANRLPLEQLFQEPDLGIINQGKNVWAIHLHGLFNNGPWRRFWLNDLRQKRGLSSLATGIADSTERREMILDNLANHIEKHIDLAALITDYDY
jgi:adenosylcobyric acid synthase